MCHFRVDTAGGKAIASASIHAKLWQYPATLPESKHFPSDAMTYAIALGFPIPRDGEGLAGAIPFKGGTIHIRKIHSIGRCEPGRIL